MLFLAWEAVLPEHSWFLLWFLLPDCGQEKATSAGDMGPEPPVGVLVPGVVLLLPHFLPFLGVMVRQPALPSLP